MRYRSQTEDTFSGKIVAALRNEFGGHAVEKV
jgi:6-phosphogluconate dehydrogenase